MEVFRFWVIVGRGGGKGACGELIELAKGGLATDKCSPFPHLGLLCFKVTP